MDYRHSIQRALDFIEAHLADELSVAALAREVGYSEYHFLRIFRETVGLTPADYIRKRRVSEIVREMLGGGNSRPIADIAYAYGFQSAENFIRAFKREHRILPTEFRTAQNSLRLYGKLVLEPLEPLAQQDEQDEPFRVDASLVWLEPFRVFAYPCTEEYPPRFWNIYNTSGCSKRLSGEPLSDKRLSENRLSENRCIEDYGVCRWNPVRGRLDYWIGVRESDAHGDLSGTVTLDIAGGLYAVFDTPVSAPFEFISTIHRTWDYISRVWLGENGFRRTGGYEFETYAEESRTYTEKIWIPIEKTDDTTEV